MNKLLIPLLVLVFTLSLQACGSGGGVSNTATGNSPASNRAQFVFECDLNGANGVLTMQVEAINRAGLVFGSGPNPDITGVIGTGQVLYYTSGTLISNVVSYSFSGENNFADFSNNNVSERFRVEWRLQQDNLTIIVNPFGSQPTSHVCRRQSATRI